MVAASIVFLILLASVGYIIWSSINRKEEEALFNPPADAFTATASFGDAAPDAPVQEPAPFTALLTSEGEVISDGASRLGLAPGWYPDPDGSHETYFDGSRWGETRPREGRDEGRGGVDLPTV